MITINLIKQTIWLLLFLWLSLAEMTQAQNSTVKSHQKISDTQGGFTGVLGNNNRFGVSVASVGDLNRDGATDIAVGAILDDDPDLIVSSSSFSPASGTVGTQVTINVTVKNDGSGTAGSSRVDYYFSTNTTITTSDHKLGEDTVSSLAPGQTSNEQLVYTIPSNVPIDTYYVGWIVDAANQVEETDETNDFFLANPQFALTAAIPDIRVSTTSLSFGIVNVGSTDDQILTIFNDGSVVLSLNSITSDNSVFSATPTSFTVNPNNLRDVTVSFNPTTESTQDGVLTINSNDPDNSSLTVSLSGTGSNVDYENFQMVANGAGPIDPPEGAAADFQGFPSLRPTDGQQVGAGHWFFHTGDDTAGNRRSYAAFLSKSMRNDNFDRFVPNDWEMRFTGSNDNPGVGGSYAVKAFTTGTVHWVPFELWCIGVNTPDDPSDDFRLIPWFLEDIGGIVNDIYDLGQGDHSVSGEDNDPYTDWIYWIIPAEHLNFSPGTAGYDDYIASLDMEGGIPVFVGSYGYDGAEVIAKSVLVNWNGGSATPFNQDLPELGSIIRLISTKPGSPAVVRKGDVTEDGIINVQDLIKVINIILGLEEPTEGQRVTADMNGDGEINVNDLIAIINIILGIG